MTTPSNPNPMQPPPPLPRRYDFGPLPADISPVLIIEALLKYPGRIIHELQHNWRAGLTICLLVLALLGMAAYGAVVGTFSGGDQIWIAPAKVALGTLLCVAICLPSLYIFACLTGVDTRLRTVTGVLSAAIALCALLLVGFAPVAWIFSQSTDSVAFMAGLHLALWGIAILFGLRLIGTMERWLTGYRRSHLKLWGCIFIVVCLQMMTTLRPIVGTSAHFLPGEKKFFLAYWFETLNEPSRDNHAPTRR